MKRRNYLALFIAIFFIQLTADGFVDAKAAGTWTMIGIPCDLGASNTVGDVFGDDFPGTYLYDWIIYQHDAASDTYSYLPTLNSTLEQGKGYWLFSDSELAWDVTCAAATQYTTFGLCDAPDGCFEVPLTSPSSEGQSSWNLVGHPGNTTVDWADVKVVIEGDEFTPSGAESQGDISKTIHKYTGSNYASFDDVTPGQEGQLKPQEGFWVEVKPQGFGKTIKLLGPSVNDVEAQFAGVETMTSDSGALLNTHHDILDASQAYSGAVIECTDCHDMDAGLLTNDPDTTDGRVPQPGISWTGSTFLSEWCVDCHDNSFPTSVTPPTNPMVDISVAWAADQHGGAVAGSNPSLNGGYQIGDILECDVCHVSGHGEVVNGTTYTNLAQLRAVIYDTDGTTPLLPEYICDAENAYVVRVLNVDSANNDPCTNGMAWCSTCHVDPMGGNQANRCLECHTHGVNAF
jgi:hypothetical protein